MKLLSLLSIAIFLAACNNNQEKQETATSVTDSSDVAVAAVQSPVDPIVTAYLDIQKALAADDDVSAANAAQNLAESLKTFDASSLQEAARPVYQDVEEDMKEHADHIYDNKGNIAHQREHFDILSRDVYDLVKAAGSSQTLYKTHCPMYKKNKGAYWIASSKEVSNPYMGQKMPDCGEVQEELK